METRAVEDFLRKVSLFQDLDGAELARLSALAREESYPSNRILFREGDPVDSFYLVRAGCVTVFRDVKGKPLQLLARLEEGGFFGEMGLLNKARRLATARTLGPTTVLRMDKTGLLEVLADNPGLELKFRAEIIRRHGMNVSALFGLAGLRDVRIRIGVPAQIELPDGARSDVLVENLSLGGVALSGVPEDWQPGRSVRCGLGVAGDPPLLQIAGAVTWRRGDMAGIAFDPLHPGDEALVYRALRRFLDVKG
jgi:CRP-like cAMP-binding protein